MKDQAQKLRELARSTPINSPPAKTVRHYRLPRSIAVTSGKGGVGKSNIALYLAVSLTAMKKKVLLVDADLGLANAHILLGVAPKRSIAHFMENTCRLEECISTVSTGFDLLAGASGIENCANSDTLALMRLQQAFEQVEKEYDFLVIDTGAGIGSVVTRFAANADMALVIMTPEPTSLADAYAMVKVLTERSSPSLGVVVNMASNDREGTEIFDKLNTLVVKFLKRPLVHFGTLPFYPEVGRAVRRQYSILEEHKNSLFSIRLHGIARRLQGNEILRRQGFFERLFHKKPYNGDVS